MMATMISNYWWVGVFAVAAVTLHSVLWYRYWNNQGKMLQKTGYLPPPPSLCARFANMVISRLAAKWMIGPVKVYGRENLPKTGRILYAPTHSHAFDFSTLIKALPFRWWRVYRTIASSSELKGVKGVLGAWTGTFGVNKQDPHELRMRAVEAAAECLVPDAADPRVGKYTTLLWFPTGLLYKQNDNLKLKPEIFKGNWARVATLAAERSGKTPVWVQPVAMYYNTDLSRAPRWIQKLSKKYRNAWGDIAYGATVVFGKPICVSDDNLPKDEAAARQYACDMLQPYLDEARALDEGKPVKMSVAEWRVTQPDRAPAAPSEPKQDNKPSA